jgi:hypothetical protein
MLQSMAMPLLMCHLRQPRRLARADLSQEGDSPPPRGPSTTVMSAPHVSCMPALDILSEIGSNPTCFLVSCRVQTASVLTVMLYSCPRRV